MPTIFLANGLVTEVQIAQIGWKQPILDISPNNLNGLATATDYGRLGRKLRSLHGWKSTPIPKLSDFFNLCLYWVSIVRGNSKLNSQAKKRVGNIK